MEGFWKKEKKLSIFSFLSICLIPISAVKDKDTLEKKNAKKDDPINSLWISTKLPVTVWSNKEFPDE